MPAVGSYRGKGKRPTLPRPPTIPEGGDRIPSVGALVDSSIQTQVYSPSRDYAQSEKNIPLRTKVTPTSTRSNSLPGASINSVTQRALHGASQLNPASGSAAVPRPLPMNKTSTTRHAIDRKVIPSNEMGPEHPERMSNHTLIHGTEHVAYGYSLETRNTSYSSAEFSQSSQSSRDTENTRYSHDALTNYPSASTLEDSCDRRSMVSNHDNTALEQDYIGGHNYFAEHAEWSLNKGSRRNPHSGLISPRSSTHEIPFEAPDEITIPLTMNDKSLTQESEQPDSLTNTRKSSNSRTIFVKTRSTESGPQDSAQGTTENNGHGGQQVGAIRSMSSIGCTAENKGKSGEFQLEICVQQTGRRMVDNVTLLLDTQCEDSNWVSDTIINDLGALGSELPRPKVFSVFNNQDLTAYRFYRLDFWVSDGRKKKYTADFYPHKNPSVDMVLGKDDILKFRFLDDVNPRILGLGHRKQSKADKSAEGDSASLHDKERQEHNRRVQEDKKKRAVHKTKSGENGGGQQPERPNNGDSSHRHQNATNRVGR